MVVNAARIPPGGWHFPLPDGRQLEAHDKTTLIDRLFEHRLRSNQPTGSEERDIDNYFCTQWPSACNKEASDYGHVIKRSSNEELLHRVTRWTSGLIDRMPKGGYALVFPQEVARRAAVCRACHENRRWVGKCGGCSASTRALLSQVRKVQPAPEGLMACDLAGWENGTAVYLSEENLPITNQLRELLPPPCWRK